MEEGGGLGTQVIYGNRKAGFILVSCAGDADFLHFLEDS